MLKRYSPPSLLLLLLLLPYSVRSQQFWGMTNTGSVSDFGAIFKTDTSGSNLTMEYKFLCTTPGDSALGDLVLAPDGNYYGLCSAGQALEDGILFQYNPTTSTYTRMFDFTGAGNGANPFGSLIVASNGNLYGVTARGGVNGLGVLFEYSPAGNTSVKEYDFSGSADGASPRGSLVQTSTGKIYGMASQGGIHNAGVIFEYDPISSLLTKKIDFDTTTTGACPYGALTQATNGKLYGMTSAGGSNNLGVLFKYDTATAALTKLLDFNGTVNGATPYGSLIQTSTGELYGMTSSGGANSAGLIFEYNIPTATFSDRLDFNTTNGANPNGSLLEAANGKLYGMTKSGGDSLDGVIFSFDTITGTTTKLYAFGATKGFSPFGSLVQAASGKLYGMTDLGGLNRNGTLFSFDPQALVFTDDVDFNGAVNGAIPAGALMRATNGKLYGTATVGGTGGVGVLFQFDTATSTYTKIVDFNGAGNGYSPRGSLIQATNGRLYGLTTGGGAHNAGVLFEYDITTSTFIKRVDFDTITTGAAPQGTLMQAIDGKLYGLTYYGGLNNLGVLFSFDINALVLTKLIDFDGTTKGSNPAGALIQTNTGKMYGMASGGGSSSLGVLFEYDPISTTFTNRVTLTGANGANPYGSLLEESNGKLAGLTSSGGTAGGGVLFEYDTAAAVLSVINNFDGSSGGGYSPNGSLVLGPNGKLFGTLAFGGPTGEGAIFEYLPASSSVEIKEWFTAAATGNFPYGDLLFLCNPVQVTVQPVDTSKCLGSTVTFKVDGTGGATLSYQWFTNNTADVNDTLASYTFTVNSLVTAEPFYCAVMNGCSSQNSAVAKLTVNPLPPVPTISQNGSILTSSSATGNQWYLGGTLINGATTQIYNAVASGNYTVDVTDVNGCTSASAPSNLLFTGIATSTGAGSLSAYPNPAKDNLVVNFSTIIDTKALLTVYDLLGNQVLSVQIASTHTNGQSNLDISSLSTGMYVLRVSNTAGEVALKFIKD